MFENKKFEGIEYTRFIASWTNEVGTITSEFKDWLKTIKVNGKKLPEEIIDDIYELGTCGKMELELSAKYFYKKITEGGN